MNVLKDSNSNDVDAKKYSGGKMPTYSYIKQSDDIYPAKLRNYADMPNSLYVKGNLPDPNVKSVGIVGARSCSQYGKQTAMHFAEALAKAGVQIISGLALGIDSAAHTGCLNGGGKTFAVLGCGIDVIYPRSNKRLSDRMISTGGGILTEFEPDAPPFAYHFPVRNRIISALSDAIIIIEAKRKSGSLITASYALEQGVQIYAVPGRITDSLSAGANDLIAQGAIPAVSPNQILYDLGLLPKKIKKSSAGTSGKKASKKEGQALSLENRSYSDDEKLLLKTLSQDPICVDDICSLTGMSPSRLSQCLLTLELDGMIYSPFPGSYVRSYC